MYVQVVNMDGIHIVARCLSIFMAETLETHFLQIQSTTKLVLIDCKIGVTEVLFCGVSAPSLVWVDYKIGASSAISGAGRLQNWC